MRVGVWTTRAWAQMAPELPAERALRKQLAELTEEKTIQVMTEDRSKEAIPARALTVMVGLAGEATSAVAVLAGVVLGTLVAEEGQVPPISSTLWTGRRNPHMGLTRKTMVTSS